MNMRDIEGFGNDPKQRELAKKFNLFAIPQDFLSDPYRWFTILRNEDPIHKNEDGSILISRYEDVMAVWRNPENVVDKSDQFKTKFGEGPLLEHHTTAMLFRDPPDHDRLREIVNPFFSALTVKKMKPKVTAAAETLMDRIEDLGEVEFVSTFAFQLSIAMICEMLGVPVEDGDRIQQYGKTLLYPLNPEVTEDDIARGHQAVADFKAYLEPFLAEVRARPAVDPTENVMTALISAELQGAEISSNEIVHMCIQVLNGGHESTTNFMSWALYELLEQPDLLDDFRAKGDKVQIAIEEMVRYISPIQFQGRRASKDIELSGEVIPAGSELVFGVAAANRDDRVFERADQIILDRRPNPHLGFGAGLHICIGQSLAKLEATVGLTGLLKRFPNIERTGEAEIAPSVRFRGLKALPLRFTKG